MQNRHRRPAFLAAITLLGGCLLALAYFLDARERAARTAPPPEATWRTPEQHVSRLEALLRPMAAGDSAFDRRMRTALRTMRFLPPDGDSLLLRMTRTVEGRPVLEARVAIACSAGASGPVLVLAAHPDGRDAMQLRIDGRDGVVQSMRRATGATWTAWTPAAGLPLAIGDLQIEEAFQVFRAVRDSIALLGVTAPRPDGRTEIVVATRLEALAVPTRPATAAGPAAGRRALAFLDAESGLPRHIEILDAKDYVVRTFDEFAWETRHGSLHLVALRATSIPSRSDTRFRRLDP